MLGTDAAAPPALVATRVAGAPEPLAPAEPAEFAGSAAPAPVCEPESDVLDSRPAELLLLVPDRPSEPAFAALGGSLALPLEELLEELLDGLLDVLPVEELDGLLDGLLEGLLGMLLLGVVGDDGALGAPVVAQPAARPVSVQRIATRSMNVLTKIALDVSGRRDRSLFGSRQGLRYVGAREESPKLV
ncbi:MAG TPA: hypothetical protein VF315_08095 [Steroidobacteraceae bacterium]